jgi:glyoxylase-like metal-dependent hydrolase (beta-lactamase superfamily II)
VSSYAIDDGARLLLVDPLAVPIQLLELAADREPVVVLTAPWHERDARSLVERLAAEVFTPRPTPPTTSSASSASVPNRRPAAVPTLRGCSPGDDDRAHTFASGDRLPIGVEAFVGREENDLVLWVERVGALIPGDTLVDIGQGFEINRRLRGGVTREQVVERLRPLLDLPIDLVLPTHGSPTDRAALERALQES